MEGGVFSAECFPLAGGLTQCHTMMPICHQRVTGKNDLTMWIWSNKVLPKLNIQAFFVFFQRTEVTALAETSLQF